MWWWLVLKTAGGGVSGAPGVGLEVGSLVKSSLEAACWAVGRCCLELGVCCAALVHSHVFCVCQIAAYLWEPACGWL